MICNQLSARAGSASAGHMSSCLCVLGVQKQTDTASKGNDALPNPDRLTSQSCFGMQSQMRTDRPPTLGKWRVSNSYEYHAYICTNLYTYVKTLCIYIYIPVNSIQRWTRMRKRQGKNPQSSNLARRLQPTAQNTDNSIQQWTRMRTRQGKTHQASNLATVAVGAQRGSGALLDSAYETQCSNQCLLPLNHMSQMAKEQCYKFSYELF